jgi:hypothetical protein
MSHSQTSDVSRREFLAVAGSVGAATAVAPKASSAAADFVVTVDVTKTPFVYSCPQSPDPYNLYVDLTTAKTVSWKAVSQGSNHAVGIFFPKETPFLDPSGRPMYALLWSEREENANPIIAKFDLYASGKYEYRVAVFDKQTGTTHSEDPRIIVGSGGIELGNKLNEIRGELESLKQSSNSEEVKHELKTIEDKLSRIIASLQ